MAVLHWFALLGAVFGLVVIALCCGVMVINYPPMDVNNTETTQFEELFPDELARSKAFTIVGSILGGVGGGVQLFTAFLMFCKKYKWYCWAQFLVVVVILLAFLSPVIGITSDVREHFFDSIDPDKGKSKELMVAVLFTTFLGLDLVYAVIFAGIYIMYWSNHNLKTHPFMPTESY